MLDARGVPVKQHDIFTESNQLTEYDSTFKRDALEKLYLSERVTLLKLLPNVESMIDVGCILGDLSAAVKEYDVDFVGIDIDGPAIEVAKKRHPDATFYCLDAFGPHCDVPPAELVTAFNVFDHYEDWKHALRGLRRLTTKYINFSVNMTLDHPTIVDEDLSYIYYSLGNKRIMWGIHNVFTLAAYAATEHIGATSIEVYCYHKFHIGSVGAMANHVTPIDPRDQITGNMIITVDGDGTMAKTHQRPDLKIWIDNNVVFDSPWKTDRPI